MNTKNIFRSYLSTISSAIDQAQTLFELNSNKNIIDNRINQIKLSLKVFFVEMVSGFFIF